MRADMARARTDRYIRNMETQHSTRIISVNSTPEELFGEENLYARVLSDTKFATAVFARIAPGERQTHHVQDRPGGGDEVLFFFAGSFSVRLKDETIGPMTASTSSPLFIYVKSGDPASIINSGETDLHFFTVLAPGYQEGEITYLA